MNKERRTQIDGLIKDIETLQNTLSALSDIDATTNNVDGIKDAEQEYYDAMPESFQNGDKGSIATEAISNLEEAFSQMEAAQTAIEEAGTALEAAVEALENAKGN